MNLAQRIRLAATIMRRGSVSPKMSPSEGKIKGRLFPRFDVKPNWNLWQDSAGFESYVHEGFAGNALIYAALMYKARAVCAAPPRAYIGTDDDRTPAPDDHPLNMLLRYPNPGMSKLEWLQLVTIYFNLAGQAFIYFDRESDGDIPVAMYPLRPDKVTIIPGEDGQTIKGYVYSPTQDAADNVPIVQADMMHVKLPNPADKLAGMGSGMSPMMALAKSGDVDNDMTAFLKAFFERGAMTAGMLVFDEPLDDEAIQRIKRRWREQYGGYENWLEPGVLHGGAEYHKLTPDFDEMGFQPIDERNEARILMPFGVPPILVGAKIGLDRATYSNYEQARQAFWEDTLDPELKLFEAEYDFFVSPADGAYIRHDRNDAPAFRQDVMEQTDAALNLWRMGVPAKHAFQAVGLKVANYPGNDVSYVNTSGISESTPAIDIVPETDLTNVEAAQENATDSDDDEPG